MVGKDHKGALLVIIDRASLYIQLNKLKTRNSKKMSKTMIKRLQKSEHPLHTKTLDNDKGFADQTIVDDALNI
jgi:IS30 family transposase